MEILKKRGRSRAPKSPAPSGDTNQDLIISKIDDMKVNDEFLNDIGEEQAPPVVDIEPSIESPETVFTATQNEANQQIIEDVQSIPFVDPLLDSSVDTKPYAKGLGIGEIPAGEIPQAEFAPPKSLVTERAKPAQQIPQSAKIEPLNAEVNEMSDVERKAGAELTVASFWSGYEKLNMFMGQLLQFPIEKRLKMHNEDSLDINMKVQVALDGDMVTVNEFYDQYNKDVKEVFVVDPKLRARLEKPMMREAMRLGLIMSDKQVILLGLGEDIVTKALQCISIKGAISNFTKAMQKQYEIQKIEFKTATEEAQKASRMVDPESEEGQRVFYEMYKRIRSMEMSEVEKAKEASDLFANSAAPSQETPPPQPERRERGVEDAVVISEEHDIDNQR